MVKIKTRPEKNSKVTLADLNANVAQLTQALNKHSTVMNAAGINMLKAAATSTNTNYKSSSSSSSKSKNQSWYVTAGKAAYEGSEIKKQESAISSTAIGGLVGLNPLVIQKLGIDKAVKSIIGSTLGGIRKKWIEAGFGTSNSTKVNSAIESNKVSPVTKRLDKIYGLIDKRLGGGPKGKEEEKKKTGFLGKLLSFMGGLLKSALPLLKLAGALALLKSIWDGVKWLIDKLGGSPLGEDPVADVSNINTVKDLAKLGKGAYDITKAKTLQKASSLAKAKSAKRMEEVGALTTKLQRDAERVKRAKELSNEARAAGNVKRADKLDDIAYAKETKLAKDTDRIEMLKAKAAKDAEFAKKVDEMRRGKGAIRTGSKILGGFAIGTGIDIAASELAAYYLDKEGKHIEAESLRRQYKAVLPYTAAGTGIGAVVGGVGGAAAGGVGAAPGAVAGSNVGYAATDLTIGEIIRAHENAKTYKEHGVLLPKPDHAEISPFRAAGDWYYYTQQQLEQEGKAPSAKEELKRVWKRFNTDYTQDKEYEGHGLIDRLPDGLAKDFLYRLDHGIGTAFSAMPETFGIGMAYLKNKYSDKSTDNLTSANKIVAALNTSNKVQNPYGLTTDFDSPIATADQAALPTETIAQNTKTTNEYLEEILNAVQTINPKANGRTEEYLIPNKPNIQWSNEGNQKNNTALPGLRWMYLHGKMGGQ